MTAVKLLPMVQPSGAVDPVCGMTVDPATAKFSAQHEGRAYYFCCGGCLAKFQADPGKYLGGPEGPQPRAHSGGSKDPQLQTQGPRPKAQGLEYTCPMHPEVRQIGPGSCPLCGMALEPVTPTAEPQEDHELADMTRRFWVSVALSLPTLALAMAERLSVVQLALATPV